MVKIYVTVDKENRLISWGYVEFGFITEKETDNILIVLSKDDAFFNTSSRFYKVLSGALVRDSKLLFEEEKEKKVNEMKKVCEEKIISGFEVAIKSVSYHFNYEKDNQINFQDAYNLMQNNLLDEIDWTVCILDKKRRITLKKEEFLNVYVTAIKHKNKMLNHFHGVVMEKLKKATNINEVKAIEWGVKEKDLTFNTNNTIEKKLDGVKDLEMDNVAQKGQNVYMESTLMEVADMIFGVM